MPRALPPRTRRASLLAAAAASVLLAGCTAVAPMPTPTPTPTETVAPSGDGVLRIGTLFPTTGATAFLGSAQLAGVNAAIREINAAGGVLGAPVEIVSRDSGDASTETAEASFAAFVEKGVDVVIGPSSSVLAERLLPKAEEAGIPFISPAATYPSLTTADTAGLFSRTIPSYPHQGTLLGALLPEKGADAVALVTSGDELSATIQAPLEAALADNGGELAVAAEAGSASAVTAAVAKVTKAKPDAVVLATPDNGELTRALITALSAAGYGGAKLWLTSQNLADYSQSLPAGLLNGANGVLEGVQPDDAFIAKLKVEDPGLTDPRYAAEAYDATMIAALAATLAGDDGGPSIASRVVQATRDGIRCTSFGECIDVLSTEPDIAYEGIVGALRLDDAGDPTYASYGLYAYNAENKYGRTGTVSG
ncbi:ABC transporter substrate-binding protein [Protaetiibacter intestinalis]|uniref:Amino acid ABC transporter substrate-binding protein n=1 Tax=Protaetiibacter intestinalis TaxID=2419774 RepID=A0A387B1X6_9MICO|nr:ABC transporter substrate-binding protein [Protaetiibacter intestinalis]AYF97514.1 amino acid ABC transporter substrate-binding protein [Protaetiibacter intestinalis]